MNHDIESESSSVGAAPVGTAPELIVRARRMHTMAADAAAPADGSAPTAIAVADGRIAALGGDAEIAALAGPNTRVIELDGAIVPSFTDAHAHPIMSLSMARGADLLSCTTRAEVAEALRAEAARGGADDWVLGWGLDPNVLLAGDPDAADADTDGAADSTADASAGITNGILHSSLGEGRKAYVTLFDAHSAIASQAALAEAGLDGPRSYPSGSAVVADARGVPTGHLLEFEAMSEVQEFLPIQTIAEKVEGLHSLLGAMAAQGIGEIHVMDMNDPDVLELLEAAEAHAPLPVKLRISPWCIPAMSDEECAELVTKQALHGQRWRVGGVKFFIDGTVEGGTAWLETPDSKGESTTSVWGEIDGYAARVRELHAAGVPTATHAIGERGIREVVETLAALPEGGVRHRVEHIESVPKPVIELMGRAGVAASMQPTHCTHYTKADGSDDWSQRLGEVRAARAWCTRDVLDAGAILALGSDYPVAPYEALKIMADAQLRRPVDEPGADPILLDQRLTAAEVLAGYTTGPHRAIDEDGGYLAVGAPASFAVLDVDPLAVSAEELGAAKVLLTVSEGLVTHSLTDSRG